MYKTLKEMIKRPKPYSIYTTDVLWTKPHIAAQMLKCHLDQSTEAASRNSDFIQNSINFLADRFNIRDGIDIIDFGCGPGLYTTAFAKLGANVTGIDFSASSLDYAKDVAQQENLNINYEHVNYLNYIPSMQFDLITMIYCDFCALSPDQRKTLLGVMKKCLKKDGRLFMDVSTTSMFNNLKEKRSFAYEENGGFFSPNSHFTFLNTYLYNNEKVSLDYYRLIEEDSTWEIYNWLQYYTKESLIEELVANGFTVTEVFSDVTGKSFDPAEEIMAVTAI